MAEKKTTTKRTTTKKKAAAEQAQVELVQPARAQEAPARTISKDDLQQWIAVAAYYRAERRGFQGGDPQQDWFAAEQEILAQL